LFLFKSSNESYGTAKIHGEDFNLLQVHIHTQSEHEVEGVHSALEIHYVHQNPETNQYGVIGIMCDVGENGPNTKFFQTLEFAVDSAQSVNFATLLATLDTTK